MAWAKNGTPNTLSGTADDCDITDLTAYKFNVFLSHWLPSGTPNAVYTFNNNTNTVYAIRRSEDGATDTTATSESNFGDGTAYVSGFNVMYVCSISGEEKLGIYFTVGQNTAGAGTAPKRKEQVLKFVPSPDADITRIDMNNNQASQDYASGTNISALGTD